ncbi:MAG: hypothetical protein JWM20_617 [Patescibacteria group bacterium]|nr:hypothetical protein [Patescibacteria group bacterium]
MENMDNLIKKPAVDDVEENLSVDADGNARTLRTLMDGSVGKYSHQEELEANTAFRENSENK